MLRVRRILHDCDSAALLDRQQTRGAVIEISRQDDADDLWPGVRRRTSKERINCRPMTVFARTAHDANHSIASVAMDEEMMVRRCDIDHAGLIRLPILGMLRGQFSAATEKKRKNARSIGGNVDGDKNRRGKIGRKGPGNLQPRLDPSC